MKTFSLIKNFLNKTFVLAYSELLMLAIIKREKYLTKIDLSIPLRYRAVSVRSEEQGTVACTTKHTSFLIFLVFLNSFF